MNSYRDENESLKKQMFMLDKQKLQQEEKLFDELDSLQGQLDRCRKENEKYKKKYADATD